MQDAFSRYAPYLMDQDQQDAQELLSFVLAALHDELKAGHAHSLPVLTDKQSAQLERLSPQEAAEKEWTRQTGHDASPVRTPCSFFGR